MPEDNQLAAERKQAQKRSDKLQTNLISSCNDLTALTVVPESCFGKNFHDNISMFIEKARKNTKAKDKVEKMKTQLSERGFMTQQTSVNSHQVHHIGHNKPTPEPTVEEKDEKHDNGDKAFDETFCSYIAEFVMITEDCGEEIYDYVTDFVKETTPPAPPQQHSPNTDEARNDAAMDIGPGDTHIEGAAENLEASPPMARGNPPDMLMLPHDNDEAIMEPATALSLQHKEEGRPLQQGLQGLQQLKKT